MPVARSWFSRQPRHSSRLKHRRPTSGYVVKQEVLCDMSDYCSVPPNNADDSCYLLSCSRATTLSSSGRLGSSDQLSPQEPRLSTERVLLSRCCLLDESVSSAAHSSLLHTALSTCQSWGATDLLSLQSALCRMQHSRARLGS